MKKIALVASALAITLAGCAVNVSVPGPFQPGTPGSSALNLGTFSYSTQYQTAVDYTDQNGNFIAAGSYIICDNKSTEMYVNLTWTGGLKQVYLQFEGAKTDGVQNFNFYSYGSADYSGSAQLTATLGRGTAPLSLPGRLGAQAIVVNPVILDVKGNTSVKIQGVDAQGRYSNVLESPQAFPVVDCQ
ncbi:hypothetical protein [Deinococcus radiotolerans]|uniref:Lipoprotein n=1 Tax=Deinococcus radiotolerans TaxID=1309407 RepID=A0ABQ2FGD7_9DEIO|nr:hypothetical protein [Deinococcus radiotolerans]GGK92389.1 hypothetical protein GCM10010844_08660 [Deinococcus radiotolerans]